MNRRNKLMTDNDEQRLRELAEAGMMPSAILEPRYPHTGIGAALVVRASIYFEGGYKREKRAALAAILDAYASIARESVTSGGQALKWLWFNGTQARPFSKAPTLAALAKRTGANEGFDATHVGGDTAHEASFFEFTTFCLEQFQAELGTRIRGLDVLVFTLPIGFVRSNPGKYIELFQFAATAIDARHGHAGFAINLSPSGRTKNESSEYFMAQRLGPGVDIGNPVATKVRDLTDRIKTVDWLTLVDMDMLERVGGIDRLRSELPPDWYSLDSCAGGLLIRAGVAPEAGVIRPGAPPAAPPAYVVLNAALRAIVADTVASLQRGTANGDAPVVNSKVSSNAWLRRFDVSADELLSAKSAVLDTRRLPTAD